MANSMLAVFGLSGAELLLVLFFLAIGGVLLIGAATAVAYFTIRMLSKRTDAPQPPIPPSS